jgi:hypothetical protein
MERSNQAQTQKLFEEGISKTVGAFRWKRFLKSQTKEISQMRLIGEMKWPWWHGVALSIYGYLQLPTSANHFHLNG